MFQALVGFLFIVVIADARNHEPEKETCVIYCCSYILIRATRGRTVI
jgi:hypothetical protein